MRSCDEDSRPVWGPSLVPLGVLLTSILEMPPVAVEADPAVRPSLGPGHGIRSPSRPALAPSGRVKVLVAEDNPLSCQSLQRTVSQWGYDVEIVLDGGAALSALLKDDAPRLALLDWEMPGLSGIDVCRLLRARGDGPYTYIVLCTGKDRRRHLIDGLAAGADDYIRKPLDLQELELRLRAGRRIVLLQDELLEAQAELERLALYDSLTGLKNRGAILGELERELSCTRAVEKSVCVALCDLDFFKRINDTHGHPTGDAVLKEFARRVCGVISARDDVGRYGGEEFLIMFSGARPADAMVACERIRRSTADAPVDSPSGKVAVTVSFGVAGTEQGYSSAESLIAAADEALYAAKSEGRNRTNLARARTV